MEESFQKQLAALKRENLQLKEQLDFAKKFMANSNYWETYRDKTGQIIYISPKLEDTLGERKEAYLKGDIQITDFIHEDDIEKTIENYKKVMQGIDVPPIKCRLNSTLSLEYVLIDYKRVLDDDGRLNGIRTCISDITELEKKERNKHNNEELLRNTTDHIPALIGQIDNNLKYTYVNKRYADYTGIEADKIIGSNVIDVISEETFKISHPYMLRALAGEFVSFETRYINSAGEVFYFESNFVPNKKNNQVKGFMVLAWDITERKKVEQALKQSEEKFHTLFSDSRVVKLLISAQKDGKIIDANEAASNFYGYSIDKLCIMKINQINILSESEIRERMNEAELKKQNYFEFKHRLASGEIKDVEVFSNPVMINNESVLHSIIVDITERKKAEHVIKENQVQLKELNATKDKLFSIIAHDLRSPFTNIYSLSGLLTDDEIEIDISKSRSITELINSAAKNSLSLLDNLLNWSKSQTGTLDNNPKKIALSHLLNKIEEELNAQAAVKNISLNIIQSKETEIFADENMVNLIFRNLVSNAIKFTNQGGRIDVIAIEKPDVVEISVADNGVGIPEDKLIHLFKINSEAQSVGTANEKGSGLGLILCKEFVEKLGGKIWVESIVGKGSNFKFTVPLHK